MSLETDLIEVSNRYPASSIEKVIPELKIPELKEETEISEELPEEDNDDFLIKNNHPDLEYSFRNEELATVFYNSQPLDYEKLFAAENKSTKLIESGEEYWSVTARENTQSEIMTNEGAKEMVQNYQFASVLGTSCDISYTERKSFSTWVLFNHAERQLFHKLYALTEDVDYSRTFN